MGQRLEPITKDEAVCTINHVLFVVLILSCVILSCVCPKLHKHHSYRYVSPSIQNELV